MFLRFLFTVVLILLHMFEKIMCNMLCVTDVCLKETDSVFLVFLNSFVFEFESIEHLLYLCDC